MQQINKRQANDCSPLQNSKKKIGADAIIRCCDKITLIPTRNVICAPLFEI
jgi:hypothetical protein